MSGRLIVDPHSDHLYEPYLGDIAALELVPQPMTFTLNFSNLMKFSVFRLS